MASIKRPVQISEFVQTITNISDHEELISINANIIKTINKLNESILLMLKEQNLITETYKKSISSLNESSNDSLNDDDETTQDYKNDMKLYNESIQENKIVLNNNYQRLMAIKDEITRRGIKPDNKIQVFSLHEVAKRAFLSEENWEKIKDKDPELYEINEQDGIYI